MQPGAVAEKIVELAIYGNNGTFIATQVGFEQVVIMCFKIFMVSYLLQVITEVIIISGKFGFTGIGIHIKSFEGRGNMYCKSGWILDRFCIQLDRINTRLIVGMNNSRFTGITGRLISETPAEESCTFAFSPENQVLILPSFLRTTDTDKRILYSRQVSVPIHSYVERVCIFFIDS